MMRKTKTRNRFWEYKMQVTVTVDIDEEELEKKKLKKKNGILKLPEQIVTSEQASAKPNILDMIGF